jgi:hypothetical protein
MCTEHLSVESSTTLADLIGQAQAQAGYEVNPTQALVIRAVTLRDALAAETIVKSERLSGNGVYVLKTTKAINGNPVPIEEYAEVIPIEGLECNGDPLAILRPTNPEIIARKRSSALAPNDVLAVGLGAYGESALLLGGMMEKMAEESAFGPLFSGMIGSSGSDETRMNAISFASGSAKNCWLALDARTTLHGNSAADAGLPPSGPIQPWESANPLHFMMGPACFAIAMAERLGEDLPEAAAIMWAEQEAAFEGAQTHPPVVEEVDNKTAYRFDVDGLNLAQSTASLERHPQKYVQHASTAPGKQPGFYRSAVRGPSLARLNPPDNFMSVPTPDAPPPGTPSYDVAGYMPMNALQAGIASSRTSGAGSMTIHKISLWIDAQQFVRLKTRMEGVMQQDGESRDIFMETELKDYKTVPGTSLYEPYREIMRVGGVMDAKQQAEMQEAMKKMDEYEQQLASMPASQRAMMEKMIGPQIEQMRSMASGGAVEFEIITTSIEINPDLMAPATLPSTMAPNVVQIVQQHLVTLGYDPGNTDGELTKQTVVAISKYQAANGMEVTGQATPQLAGVLSAAVDAMN